MKKRMIAWLLCACMTFTAAPEMLLADVAGNAQQTQEENSFKEKGTVETQTVEQDDEKSAVTEKKETDQADEEDHNAGRLAEEESEAAGTEIVTEETEEPETTIVTEETEEPETKVVTEETEETETKNVTEEPEQAETENVTEETESTEEILKRALSGDEISRIDWVQELVTLFDLTVDEDNYYSDISTDDSFYRDVMVACEFGMIDLEAGEEFRPEDAVTREFAAQTMNTMLGFVPETDSYTYQDTADVTYKEAAQIAIDRGWVTVAAGKFLPEQSLTTEEHDAMIADAKKVLADAQIETGKENTCTFASGVVVVPKGTAVSIDVDGIVMIENCPVTIKQGTTFAVYVNDIVMAYKAESVRTDGTTTYITTSDADDGAVLNVDQQGELDVDMTEFIPADEETYVVNGVTVTEGMTRGISYKNNTLRADKTISVSDDVTATVSVVISNMKVNYSLNNNDYYFSVSGDMEYSCNVKGDAFKDINHTLTLGAVPLGGVGMLTLAMEYNLSGEATLTVEKEFEAGFAYSDGFRIVGNSHKKGFSFSAEADLTTGIVLSAKATLGIVSGDIYAKTGARMNIKYVRYSSGTPTYCASQAAYLYASVGASAKIGVGIASKTFSKSIEIWGKNNSPVRVYYHIEDGVLRTSCTRGKEFAAQGGWTSYWTSPGSRYFNPAGVGSYFDAGAGAGGAIVPIYTYTLDDANRATITGYSGNATALYIPGEIDGHEVVAIGDRAFQNRTDLRTVMIPDSVTEIEAYSFNNCTNLSNVTLSKSLKYMGGRAFGSCEKITQIEIPKSLDNCGNSGYASYHGPFGACSGLKKITFEEGATEVSNGLFRGCTGLEEINIPDGVTKIESSSFEDCINLVSVNISDSVIKIENEAFAGCEKIESINIPDSVTEIGESTFANCSKLSNVKLSKNLEYMGGRAFGSCEKITQIEIPKSLDNCGNSGYASYHGPFGACSGLKKITFEEGTTEISSGLFRGCTGLEEINIPNSVTEIESSSFEDCINLVSVNIPDSVIKIGNEAFAGCKKIESINIPDSVTEIGGSTFANCSKLSNVKLSKNLEYMGGRAFGSCEKITQIEIPKSLDNCGNSGYASYHGPFGACSGLKKITFEEGTTEISSGLFRGCTGLEEINIPDSVTEIESSSFEDSINLVSVNIPDSVIKIGNEAFAGCEKIESINIPDSVTEIGERTFANCSKLSNVKLSKNLEYMGGRAFGSCEKITQIEIPKSLDNCGNSGYASYHGPFGACSGLKKIIFEEGTKEISNNLFRGCTGLEEISIPASVIKIERYTFADCTNLKNVYFSNGVKNVENNAFTNCTSLTKVNIPDTVDSIGNSAFSGCTNLIEVHLPDKLKETASDTFSGCKKLTTINFPSTLTTIGNSAFSGCESLPEAILPSGVEKIESNAFKNCKALKKAAVPDTVSSIGSSAFYGCEALTDITLGSKLKKIESQTFYGCIVLPSIVIPYNVTTIGDSAFVNCTKLTQITVPRNTTSIASNAFSYPKKMTMYGPSDCYAQTYASGKGIKYVTQDIHATSVSLDSTEKTAERYDDFQLTATIAPLNFTDAVVWTSSNEEVAAVSDTGYVEICGVGTAVITVTAGNVKAACKITVPQLIDWIEFDEDEIELKAGQTYQLKPYISPSDATNKKLKYTSSDTKVAEVSASGLVTAKSEGEAKIRAAATDGSDEYAVCYVTVTGKAKVTGITLDRTSAEVKRGEKLTLNVTASPSYASNKKVVWKSANTKIATVDANGSVTAKAPGRTKITVTSSENSSYQASCTVTVPYKITYKLNKGKNNASNPSTYYGKKVTLKNPSRKGYAFAGWYTDAKFKKKITSISNSAKSDYILYAKWTKVKVAKASLTSAKNSKSKQILLKYKKVSGAKGYEISYSTDKKFKKAVTKKNTAKTSYTISKLKKGKIYYVRIRAYKMDSTGKKVYGKYSSMKKVKVSK
ncbi:leucine-rich repeat protein [Roseburia intestinalis]|uniref:Bacterial surface protein 26-residue repeat n=1 Tax=Roseburia intestinalis TaxID=166486 RepID=A0A173R1R4_9FIRM|nr:leucine-rich repeat protein [Roseburia intestinalis]CUM71418.1 bacterial surface protein 26-residue repeat [Roseburia intestinalis]